MVHETCTCHRHYLLGVASTIFAHRDICGLVPTASQVSLALGFLHYIVSWLSIHLQLPAKGIRHAASSSNGSSAAGGVTVELSVRERALHQFRRLHL